MRYLLLAAVGASLLACSTPPPARPMLRDIDRVGKESKPRSAVAVAPKSRDEIRRAYMEYLQHASKDDRLRADALYRLAQLEFEVSESRNKNAQAPTAEVRDQRLDAAADRTISLMQTLLRDRPNSAENDKTLYQLARAYDQRGLSDKSIETLSQLVSRYPKSPYYIESQFRIAENRFIRGDYGPAEDLYTNVLVSPNNGRFREKALYKRGWARFKQGYYREAVDDFIAATNLNDFDDLTRLSAAKRNDFDEYFRAIALSFVYMGGLEPLSEYFRSNPEFRYVYHAYVRTSDVYLSQERYADAVQALAEFNKRYPTSRHVPAVALKIVDIWKSAGFSSNYLQALEEFYTAYHPQSDYWARKEANTALRATVITALREHTVVASASFHKEYQSSKKEAAFSQAKAWYDRYLRHYAAHARKDNMDYLYAKLLSQHNEDEKALGYYEQAAFDGAIVVNGEAAYAAVETVARLLEKAADPNMRKVYRTKLISYATLYVQSQPNDVRAVAVAARAAQEAYRDGMYAQAIQLAELLTNVPHNEHSYSLNSVRANAYFRAERFQDAEAAYQALLQYHKLDAKDKQSMQDNLALSIYRQGAAAKAANKTVDAIHHYARISEIVPASDAAATGLYDALALAYEHKLWTDTVKYAERFKKLYPSHRLAQDASRKVSVAYLNTNQETAAASELVKLSRSDETVEYKIAALWKAAGLYETKKEYPAAIKAYEEYIATYQRPYPQYIEAAFKLVGLHAKMGDEARANHWRQYILDADKRIPSGLKNDRSNYICSVAALELARAEHKRFASLRLTLPLNRSLKQKKQALQKVLNLYGVVTSYGVRDTVTEATHGIGDVYYSFSKSLLESERPMGLSAIERDQYKALLEDQAFPFEDNAIKFYEKNILHTKEGIYDEWIHNSRAQLKRLFPARYNRDLLLESYVNVVH